MTLFFISPLLMFCGSQTLVGMRLTPTPRVFDSVSLQWGLRICVSNEFRGAADAAGPRITPSILVVR